MLTPLVVLLSRVRALFGSRRLDADFDKEIAAHVAMLADEHVGRGLPPGDARRAARLRFGGSLQIAEQRRRDRGLPFIETTIQDLRYALRTLRRSAGFTILAVLTLGIGIGVNTTVFTLFDAVALRGLPVKNPDTLVRLDRSFQGGGRGDIEYAFSYDEYQGYLTRARALTGVIAASWPIRVAYDGGNLDGQLVSGGYFSELGARVALGRLLVHEDEQAGRMAVVLSTACWRQRFGSDPEIAGRAIRLNNAMFTIAGVAAADFIGSGNPPRVPDFWAPLPLQPRLVPGSDWAHSPTIQRLQLLGRIAPGQTRASARAQLTVLEQSLDTESGDRRTIAVDPAHATLFGGTDDPRFRAFAVVVMTVVGLVLLIACANLSNLMLARAENRRRELALRQALGASRGRVARQLLTETTLLALAGGAAGLLFSLWACRWLWAGTATAVQGVLHADTSFDLRLGPDTYVFVYTVAVSIVAGVVFGLWPAVRSSSVNLTSALKDERLLLGRPVSRSRLRGSLIAGQVAASLALLINAGLLTRGAVRSQSADPGFPVAHIYAVMFNRGTNPQRALQLQAQAVERLQSMNDLAGVSLVERIPLGSSWTTAVADADAPDHRSDTLANYVSPGYFKTMNVAIQRGRDLVAEDSEGVAIISASTARAFWPGADPIGRRLRLSTSLGRAADFHQVVIVGVAGDVRTANASRTDPMYVYLPTSPSNRYEILIRTAGADAAALSAVRAAVGGIDPGLMPSLQFVSLAALLRSQQLVTSTLAGFITALAALALLLAASGICGVMNVLVAQRMHEIGVRVALGASRVDVVRLVFVDGLRPVAIGAAVGLVLALAGSAVARATLVAPSSPDLLFGVGAFDPATFLTIILVLAASAAAAGCVPAHRATRVDPMVALRVE